MIVDDHGIVRQGLRALLTQHGIEVVGEAENGRDSPRLVQEHQPDVVLLDIRMKDEDGLAALPAIKAAAPNTRVIMLTTYANPGYLARAIRDGASGYLSKDVDPQQIVKAVRAAAAGEELINTELLRAALSHSADITPDSETDGAAIADLSEREIEVLQLVAAGMSNADIAEALHVSISTVKTHVRHILEKLNVSDRVQAALWAVRNKLAPNE
jgi:DNA-binding NarL/FixJ family response regulator